MWWTARFICTFTETYSLIVIKLHQDHVTSHWVFLNLNLLTNVFHTFSCFFFVYLYLCKIFLCFLKFPSFVVFFPFFFFQFNCSFLRFLFLFFYLISFLSSFHFARFSVLTSTHTFYISRHILFFLEFSIFYWIRLKFLISFIFLSAYLKLLLRVSFFNFECILFSLFLYFLVYMINSTVFLYLPLFSNIV